MEKKKKGREEAGRKARQGKAKRRRMGEEGDKILYEEIS